MNTFRFPLHDLGGLPDDVRRHHVLVSGRDAWLDCETGNVAIDQSGACVHERVQRHCFVQSLALPSSHAVFASFSGLFAAGSAWFRVFAFVHNYFFCFTGAFASRVGGAGRRFQARRRGGVVLTPFFAPLLAPRPSLIFMRCFLACVALAYLYGAVLNGQVTAAARAAPAFVVVFDSLEHALPLPVLFLGIERSPARAR